MIVTFFEVMKMGNFRKKQSTSNNALLIPQSFAIPQFEALKSK